MYSAVYFRTLINVLPFSVAEPDSAADSAVSGEAAAGGEGGPLQWHCEPRGRATARHAHSARAAELGQTPHTLEHLML